jgi:hypothetical protein
VRRQGLEPRTRGLREGRCGALSALPARKQCSYARKAPSAHSPHGFRSTKRSTPPHRTARELATESDDSACQFVGRRAAWPAGTGTAQDLLVGRPLQLAPVAEQLGGSASGPGGYLAGADELWFHQAPEGVPL